MSCYDKKTLSLVLLTIGCFFGLMAQGIDLKILEDINPRNPNSGYWKTTSSSAYWVPAVAAVGTLGYGFIAGDQKAKHDAVELFLNVGISTLISE